MHGGFGKFIDQWGNGSSEVLTFVGCLKIGDRATIVRLLECWSFRTHVIQDEANSTRPCTLSVLSYRGLS